MKTFKYLSSCVSIVDRTHVFLKNSAVTLLEHYASLSKHAPLKILAADWLLTCREAEDANQSPASVYTGICESSCSGEQRVSESFFLIIQTSFNYYENNHEKCG